MERFKVGDRVVRDYNSRTGEGTVGTVIKITPKRRDVVVDYGNYKETYGQDGWSKGGDAWSHSYIGMLTPEIEKKIYELNIINKCKKVFSNKSKELTAEQAKRILEVLESNNEFGKEINNE